MTDWRQIQARIRKAKLSADPIPALTRIYDRTRDGMAAFEVATVHENEGRTEEAVGWFTKAWQRFRRVDWKQKSAEAIERLGGAPPQELTPGSVAPQSSDGGAMATMSADGELAFAPRDHRADSDTETVTAEEPEIMEEATAASGEAVGATQAAVGAVKKRSRRGRRGGRRHRRKREREVQVRTQTSQAAQIEPAESGVASLVETAPPPAPVERERGRSRFEDRSRGRGRESEQPRREAPAAHRREIESAEPPAIGGAPVGSAFAAQARAVDPGLASRMAKLESKLRRLMTSPVYSMNDIETAPAGPGVFVLSDSDHTTYYYVEACRTLRIALTNIARARTMEGSLKTKFAENLGISESQVGKYIKEHCVARWLQLDEDSSRLAHFAIAVLGPVLNE